MKEVTSITQEFVLESCNLVKGLSLRFNNEHDERDRDEYSRDYARVLYSSSLEDYRVKCNYSELIVQTFIEID